MSDCNSHARSLVLCPPNLLLLVYLTTYTCIFYCISHNKIAFYACLFFLTRVSTHRQKNIFYLWGKKKQLMDSELHISRYYMPNTTNINSKLLPKNAQTTDRASGHTGSYNYARGRHAQRLQYSLLMRLNIHTPDNSKWTTGSPNKNNFATSK